VDAKSELPVAMVVASTNENEKKHSYSLFKKASSKVKSKKLVADPQYSSQGLRDVAVSMGTVPVIPYPSNQKMSVRGVLRVDMKFRSHGSQQLRRAYRKRVAVERVFSRLKNLAGLKEHNLRGLAKITFHSQLCIIAMLLVAQAAINTHKTGKSRSIRYFVN
jgi:transposase